MRFKSLYSLSALLLLTISCDNNNSSNENNNKSVSDVVSTPILSVSVVNQYPHDVTAFTEGLEYINGYLYESTGRYGTSDIRKTNLQTGKVLIQQKMDNKYFGEGLTVLNGKIYQLTYREATGFVYDLVTLKQERTFTFNTPEGWGMTNDGKNLIFDDGSNVLHFIDPKSFAEVKRVEVTDEYGAVDNLNELEYIKGYIYANRWQTDMIIKIDPTTGKVVGKADLGVVRQLAGIPLPSGDESAPDVMNGIAYDSSTNRIFITGKYPKSFMRIALATASVPQFTCSLV